MNRSIAVLALSIATLALACADAPTTTAGDEQDITAQPAGKTLDEADSQKMIALLRRGGIDEINGFAGTSIGTHASCFAEGDVSCKLRGGEMLGGGDGRALVGLLAKAGLEAVDGAHEADISCLLINGAFATCSVKGASQSATGGLDKADAQRLTELLQKAKVPAVDGFAGMSWGTRASCAAGICTFRPDREGQTTLTGPDAEALVALLAKAGVKPINGIGGPSFEADLSCIHTGATAICRAS